jgi:hypothetical protein
MTKTKTIIKTLLLFINLFIINRVASAGDSTSTKFNSEFGISNKNMFRGVTTDNVPTVNAKVYYSPCNYFEIGSYGSTNILGTNTSRTNNLNLYASVKHKDFSLTLDDYYYFDGSSAVSYWDYSKDSTSHAIEVQVKYDDNKFAFVVGNVVIKNSADNTNGIYFGGSYNMTNDFNVFASYVTDASSLNLQTKGGFTSIGGTVTSNISNSCTLKTSLVFSPAYKTSVLETKPVNLVLALVF